MASNPRGSVSQSDVAHYLGVSTSTVSLVLRGDPRVAQATRQRVLRAVEHLGYNRDEHLEARSLRARRSGQPVRFNAVGLLWRGEHFSVIDRSFHRKLFEAIVDACWHRDQLLTLMSAQWEPARVRTAAARLDGLVVMPAHQQAIELAISCRRPAITVMGPGPAETGTADVSIDHVQAIRLAFDHLRQFGHQRIGYIGADRKGPIAAARYDAYQRCVGRAGLAWQPQLTVEASMQSVDGGGEAFERMHASLDPSQRPTAVIVYNDVMAMGVLRAAAARGLQVPRDLSIVSIDDIPEAAQTQPPLTTVHIDAAAIGRCAIDYLVQAAGQARPEVHPEDSALTVPVRLTLRDSVTQPPHDDRTMPA